MIDPLLWLIYLLSYLNTERDARLLGSRRRFDVNGLVLVQTWVSVTEIEFWWKICTF